MFMFIFSKDVSITAKSIFQKNNTQLKISCHLLRNKIKINDCIDVQVFFLRRAHYNSCREKQLLIVRKKYQSKIINRCIYNYIYVFYQF